MLKIATTIQIPVLIMTTPLHFTAKDGHQDFCKPGCVWLIRKCQSGNFYVHINNQCGNLLTNIRESKSSKALKVAFLKIEYYKKSELTDNSSVYFYLWNKLTLE